MDIQMYIYFPYDHKFHVIYLLLQYLCKDVCVIEYCENEEMQNCILYNIYDKNKRKILRFCVSM